MPRECAVVFGRTSLKLCAASVAVLPHYPKKSRRRSITCSGSGSRQLPGCRRLLMILVVKLTHAALPDRSGRACLVENRVAELS
jgi:hypothetical protein